MRALLVAVGVALLVAPRRRSVRRAARAAAAVRQGAPRPPARGPGARSARSPCSSRAPTPTGTASTSTRTTSTTTTGPTRARASRRPASPASHPASGDMLYPAAGALRQQRGRPGRAAHPADGPGDRLPRHARRRAGARTRRRWASASTPTAAAAARWTGRGGAGISSPGLDRFITAWGTRGRLTRPNGTGTVPAGRRGDDRHAHEPDDDPGPALPDGPGPRDLALRDRHRPVGGRRASGARRASFNLGFRFDEGQPRGSGTWFEADQAKALAGGTSGRFHADVSFARLARGDNALDPRAGTQAGAHLSLAPEAARGRPARLPRVRRPPPALPRVRAEDLPAHPPRGRHVRAPLAVGDLHAVRRLLAQPAAAAGRRGGPLLRHPARPRPRRLVHRRGRGRLLRGLGATWRGASGSTRRGSR